MRKLPCHPFIVRYPHLLKKLMYPFLSFRPPSTAIMRISPHAWLSAFKRHAIVKRLTVGVAADIAQCDGNDTALGDLKMVAARHVWRDQATRFAPQWRFLRQRFRFGHVERGATDSSFRERVGKRLKGDTGLLLGDDWNLDIGWTKGRKTTNYEALLGHLAEAHGLQDTVKALLPNFTTIGAGYPRFKAIKAVTE